MKYILAIIGFGILIIVHELGHFIMAKVNKVKVLEFNIGMGPKIFSYKGKETTYSLCLLPIGGMCIMLNGEENIDDPGCILNKSHLQRMSIMIAGVFMNVVLAIVCLTLCSCKLGYVSNTIDEILDNQPAYEAGLKAGDEITKINDKKIYLNEDVSTILSNSNGEEISVSFMRDGESHQVNFAPKYNDEQGKYMMGVAFKIDRQVSVLNGLKHSLYEIKFITNETVRVIWRLITFRGNFVKDLGGPVSVVKVSSQAAEIGIWPLVDLVGMLSISLAIFNFLPFPALDGCHTFLLLIELITRKKIPEKVLVGINTFGFICLMVLMLAVTIKDIIYPMDLGGN